MHILRELWMKEIEEPDVKSSYEYVLNLHERLDDTLKIACEELEKAQGRQKRYYDRTAKRRKFSVGEKVLVLLPTDSNKLLMQWKGPFEIVTTVGINDYRINMGGKEKTFHANLLKGPVKCLLGSRIVDFLGHSLGRGTIGLQDENVEKVRNAPRPKTKREVRAFLGLIGYYKEFVPNFAAVSAPLSDLVRKGQPNIVNWGDSQERAYNSLKVAVTSKPVLQLPYVNKKFVLRTDASDRRLGAALMQENEGTLFPVAYASKNLTDRERKYSVTEREALAIVWGVKSFHFIFTELYLSQLYSHPQWPHQISPGSQRERLKKSIDHSFLWLFKTHGITFVKEVWKKRNRGEPVSFTDLFGHLVGNTIINDRLDAKLSDQRNTVDQGQSPLPLYTCLHVKKSVSAMVFHEWMEFSPFEVGLAKYGTFMKTEQFACKFFMGKIIRKFPEPPLHFLQGL
ncbi:cytosolic phospholipase a2 [Plakobranchus ocellatus]|uniref:Cytosolic phospholipase a2 n=1 Tax=Plakobranchus ocellatus TaxID=259542 RepID=A0AAV4DYV2_9GAST|nr:cytosolic phospholipase a2 [Plakobranchus ocellatus]